MKQTSPQTQNFVVLMLTALFVVSFPMIASAQGKIAFTSNFAGNNNIYLMNSNGTGQVALTTNPASDAYPDLSHNGNRIVFQSDRDGNIEIYSMDSTGAFLQRLTNNPAQDTEPVYSPDGSKIVFESNRDGNFEIYIMNADGSGQMRLTTNASDDGQAEFSPDGSKIIFARLSGAESHIYTMNLDGTVQTPLTSGLFEINGYPSYSPNGQKIVFSRANLSHTNGEIYVMDANGANAVRLTAVSGDDLEAAFSPDGSKIAFRSERDGNAEIYVMDSNGANQTRVTFDGTGVTNFAPTWSSVSIVSVDIPDNLAAAQGATLTVPIVVSDTTGRGIVSYDLGLNYDPAVLQPLPAVFEKAGTLSSSFEINSGKSEPGRIEISAFGTAPLSGAGNLLLLKFTVIGTPPTSSTLILDPFVFNEGLPFAEISPGNVFVQGTISGTVFYGTSVTPIGVPNVLLSAAGDPGSSTSTATDGTYTLGGFGPGAYTVTPSKSGDISGITALDASLISQFLVGVGTLSENQQIAGEVSGNGTLTSFDAALIAQYVVSLPNTGLTGTWRFSPASRFYETVGNMMNEDYSAILMGEVSGNWIAGTGLRGQLARSAPFGKDETRFRGPSELTASLPTVGARQNSSITIPVMVKWGSIGANITAYQFDIIYDPAVIQPELIPFDTVGTLSGGFGAASNTTFNGRLKVAVYGANLINSNGTLIYLRFRVVGQPGSRTSLDFKNLMFNEGDPIAEAIKGEIVVKDQPAEEK
jgi:Tol biopolymer transport system component